MITKYRVGWMNDKTIKKVDVVRETEKMVWLPHPTRSRGEAKHSQYCHYFDTWQEAKDFLIEKFTRKIKSSKSELAFNEKALAEITELEQPIL